jgi:hypothetical protein
MGVLKRRTATVELEDGRILEDVRIIAADTIRYEETAQRHRWPAMVVKNETGTVPILNHKDRFEIWSALKRLDLYTGSWEEFTTGGLIDYTIDEEDVNPTRPDLEEG